MMSSLESMDLLDEEGTTSPLSTPPHAVSIRIVGSKTDVYNVGEVREHFRSEHHDGLCPVVSLAEMRRHFPHRFDGGGGIDPPPLPVDGWLSCPAYANLFLA